MGITDTLFGAISKLWFEAFGSNELKHYEEFCLSSMGSALSAESQRKMALQLAKFGLVQRQGYELKTVFYDVKDPKYLKWSNEDLFDSREQNLKVFTGVLIGHREDVEARIRFEIFLHRGRLSSIEFESEPTLMEGFERLEVTEPKWLVKM